LEYEEGDDIISDDPWPQNVQHRTLQDIAADIPEEWQSHQQQHFPSSTNTDQFSDVITASEVVDQSSIESDTESG